MVHPRSVASVLVGLAMAVSACSGSGSGEEAVVAAAEPTPTSPTAEVPTATSTPTPVSLPPLEESSLTFDRQLVPATPFDAPYGVDVDADGNVYVFDSGNHRVVVFDDSGNEIGGWGGQGSEPGRFDSLGFGSLAIGDDGSVFVVDNGNHRIQRFDATGTLLAEWGTEGDGDGEFRRPIGIAVVGDEVFVTDDEIPRVQVFGPDGTFLRSIGEAGDQPGGLVHATGIAVDDEGNVWVADYEAQRVQRFGPDGSPEGIWRNPGPAGTFRVPEGLAVDADGTVLATGYDRGEIWLLPAEPATEMEWTVVGGGQGAGDGAFRAPVDVAIGPDGAVYVTDQSTDTVQRFVR